MFRTFPAFRCWQGIICISTFGRCRIRSFRNAQFLLRLRARRCGRFCALSVPQTSMSAKECLPKLRRVSWSGAGSERQPQLNEQEIRHIRRATAQCNFVYRETKNGQQAQLRSQIQYIVANTMKQLNQADSRFPRSSKLFEFTAEDRVCRYGRDPWLQHIFIILTPLSKDSPPFSQFFTRLIRTRNGEEMII